MKLADLLRRIDEPLDIGQDVLSTRYQDGRASSVFYIKGLPMDGFRSAALSFIERVYGRDHTHYQQFTEHTAHTYQSSAESGLAILKAIRTEIAGGWLFTIRGLVAAEMFSDFLDMAQHLLDQGYKDPAAVVIGSVLEEHLRQLCVKHSIDIADPKGGKMIPRKADRLNSDLTKNETYTALDQKQITAWLGLRNDAAHGKYASYTEEQVKNYLAGVTEFMARVAP
ncbi:MAG: hypothetical protein IH855_11025 [Bacteroidetes bacterium]|nr:hypothetical protein [Bacteroidota bacterium]